MGCWLRGGVLGMEAMGPTVWVDEALDLTEWTLAGGAAGSRRVWLVEDVSMREEELEADSLESDGCLLDTATVVELEADSPESARKWRDSIAAHAPPRYAWAPSTERLAQHFDNKRFLKLYQVFAGWNGTRHLALHRLAARRVKRGMKGVLEGWGAWAEQRSTRLSAVRDGRVQRIWNRRRIGRLLFACAHWKVLALRLPVAAVVLALRLPVAAVVRDVVGDPPHDPHADMRTGEDWVVPMRRDDLVVLLGEEMGWLRGWKFPHDRWEAQAGECCREGWVETSLVQ
ncbi:hypothetical protein T484DRAFT_1778797, partial [Baffinella frigidus]